VAGTFIDPTTFAAGLVEQLRIKGITSAPSSMGTDEVSPVIDVGAGGFTKFGTELDPGTKIDETVQNMGGFATTAKLVLGRDSTAFIPTVEQNARIVALSIELKYVVGFLPAAGFEWTHQWRITRPGMDSVVIFGERHSFVANQFTYMTTCPRWALTFLPYDCNITGAVFSGDGTNFPANADAVFGQCVLLARAGRQLPI